MEPTDRVWTGDTEIVYETARGYEWFVAELVGCFGDFGISDLREIWHRTDDNAPLIELVFRHDDETHHCWLQRHNDFLDPHLWRCSMRLSGEPDGLCGITLATPSRYASWKPGPRPEVFVYL
jgi:hypothetical protein